jgi:hypothetical protein
MLTARARSQVTEPSVVHFGNAGRVKQNILYSLGFTVEQFRKALGPGVLV